MNTYCMLNDELCGTNSYGFCAEHSQTVAAAEIEN